VSVCLALRLRLHLRVRVRPSLGNSIHLFIFLIFFSLRPTNRCHPCPSKAVTCDAQPLVCAAVCAYVYVYLCAFVRAAMSEWVSE
jgi:hypothetical protein